MRTTLFLIILLFSTSIYSQEEDLELIDDVQSSIRKIDIVVLEVITQFLEFDSETGNLKLNQADLEKVTILIKKLNPTKILIQVHTSIKGEPDENYRISVIAGQNLKDSFGNNNINIDKIEVIGMGASNPIKKNVSELDDLKYNKRIKLILQFDTD